MNNGALFEANCDCAARFIAVCYVSYGWKRNPNQLVLGPSVKTTINNKQVMAEDHGSDKNSCAVITTDLEPGAYALSFEVLPNATAAQFFIFSHILWI